MIVEECPCFCGAHANPAFARNFRRVARCFAFAFAVGDQTAHAAIAWTWTKKRMAWVADSNVYIHAVAKLCCNDRAVFFASLAFRNANISLGTVGDAAADKVKAGDTRVHHPQQLEQLSILSWSSTLWSLSG